MTTYRVKREGGLKIVVAGSRTQTYKRYDYGDDVDDPESVKVNGTVYSILEAMQNGWFQCIRY